MKNKSKSCTVRKFLRDKWNCLLELLSDIKEKILPQNDGARACENGYLPRYFDAVAVFCGAIIFLIVLIRRPTAIIAPAIGAIVANQLYSYYKALCAKKYLLVSFLYGVAICLTILILVFNMKDVVVTVGSIVLVYTGLAIRRLYD